MKQKDQSIETLRGLAILLVVAGYIIEGNLNDGPGTHSHVAALLHFIYYILIPIRMPLFTVISAYLYAASPATQNTLKKLIVGKTRRILIPFFSVSAIQYIDFWFFHVGNYGPLHEIYKIYLYPFEQFWFLCAIFWIFIIVGCLDSIKLLETKEKWFGCLAFSIILSIAFEPTRLFAIHGVNYLLPFFLMGYGIRRYSTELFTARMIKSYIITVVIAYIPYILFYSHFVTKSDPEYKIMSLLVTFSAVPLLFYFRQTVPLLAKIGYYAFGIHIFNKISSGFPEKIFEHYHIDGNSLIFITYLSCAVLLSIGFTIIMEKFNFTRKYILGIKEAYNDSPPKNPVAPQTFPLLKRV